MDGGTCFLAGFDRRARRLPASRAFEDARYMPTPLGPDHHIGIGTDGDRLGIPFDVADEFDVIEVGEYEFLGAFDATIAEIDG